MDRLTSRLTWLLNRAERLLPPGQRQWAEAVRAETGQVPVGWPRVSWIAGGLWLVVRETKMARKIGYWLGVGAVTVIAAWAAWTSLRTTPGTDLEALTDRFRVLVTLTALVALPWLGRRQGAFGPVGPGVLARFVRIAGCGAICYFGWALVHIDVHAKGGPIGNGGGFNPVEEFSGLAALAVVAAAPFVIRARWPQAGREVYWCVMACAAVTALVLIPLQAIAVGLLALILAATSRRSPVRPSTLLAGIIGGLPNCLIIYVLFQLAPGPWPFLLLLFLGSLLCTMIAGAGAAWLIRDTGQGEDLRSTRVRQGTYAGITAGITGGLVPSLVILIFFFMIVIGPLAGVLGGRVGAALAADHLPNRRPGRSISVGLFVSD
jgi:hypothetical protein